MNIRLIALITFLFVTYNCQANIRKQLEQHQRNIRNNAKKTEFELKYPDFLLSPETYKGLSEQEKKDFQKVLDRSMKNELINRLLNCMEDQSNTAEKCFDDQSFDCSKVLEEELDTEDVDEEFRNAQLICFESAKKEIANIIFNPENN